VIQASQHQHRVTVTAGKEVLASNLAFGNLTSYRVANPGTWTFRAVGDSEHTSRTIKLVPDCIHTIVILDLCRYRDYAEGQAAGSCHRRPLAGRGSA